MADSHYLNGKLYVHMNQVNKLFRALMIFTGMYRTWVFFQAKSIRSLSIREVLDDISDNMIPGSVLWSTYSQRLKAPGKTEDMTLTANPG